MHQANAITDCKVITIFILNLNYKIKKPGY
jgi:hypothetical protein